MTGRHKFREESDWETGRRDGGTEMSGRGGDAVMVKDSGSV